MKLAIRLGACTAVILSLFLPAGLPAARGEDAKPGIHADLAAALALANASDKLLLVDFSGSWCPWCVKMDKTFADPGVAALIQKNFLYLQLDVGRFDKHAECLKYYNITGIPYRAVFSPDGTLR